MSHSSGDTTAGTSGSDLDAVMYKGLRHALDHACDLGFIKLLIGRLGTKQGFMFSVNPRPRKDKTRKRTVVIQPRPYSLLQQQPDTYISFRAMDFDKKMSKTFGTLKGRTKVRR